VGFATVSLALALSQLVSGLMAAFGLIAAAVAAVGSMPVLLAAVAARVHSAHRGIAAGVVSAGGSIGQMAWLGVLGLANVAGSIASGMATQRFEARRVLALVYAARAVGIVLFVAAPKTPGVLFGFGVWMGLTYLATVPADLRIARATLRRAAHGDAVRPGDVRPPVRQLPRHLAWRHRLRALRRLRLDVVPRHRAGAGRHRFELVDTHRAAAYTGSHENTSCERSSG
jgi:hypothetical protein